MAQTNSPVAAAKKNDAEDAPPPAPRYHFTGVINNRESKIVGQLPSLGKDSSGVPQPGDRVEIIPGFNLVPTSQFDVLMQNRIFASLFTEKIGSSKATEHNIEKQGQPILVKIVMDFPQTRPFSKLETLEAEDLIKEVFHAKMLHDWYAGETRDVVRLALQRQIKLLKDGGVE